MWKQKLIVSEMQNLITKFNFKIFAAPVFDESVIQGADGSELHVEGVNEAATPRKIGEHLKHA